MSVHAWSMQRFSTGVKCHESGGLAEHETVAAWKLHGGGCVNEQAATMVSYPFSIEEFFWRSSACRLIPGRVALQILR